MEPTQSARTRQKVTFQHWDAVGDPVVLHYSDICRGHDLKISEQEQKRGLEFAFAFVSLLLLSFLRTSSRTFSTFSSVSSRVSLATDARTTAIVTHP
jgi:hypothetical protein